MVFVSMLLFATVNRSFVGSAHAESEKAGSVNVAGPPRDAIRTASGLAMIVLEKGHGGEHPQVNDCVKLSFVARTSDGAVFAQSASSGEPNVECVRHLTPGIAEAVRAMLVGERRRIWVPSRLNGTSEESGKEAPRAPDLIYELTLVSVLKAPPTPAPLKAPPADAKRLASGLALKTLAPGSGRVHPTASSKVTLHLSGWTTNGVLFESTLMSNQPAIYVVDQLLPGLREGVEQMVVGERTRLWLPAELAFGAKPRKRSRPAGKMVYDVELLALE